MTHYCSVSPLFSNTKGQLEQMNSILLPLLQKPQSLLVMGLITAHLGMQAMNFKHVGQLAGEGFQRTSRLRGTFTPTLSIAVLFLLLSACVTPFGIWELSCPTSRLPHFLPLIYQPKSLILNTSNDTCSEEAW